MQICVWLGMIFFVTCLTIGCKQRSTTDNGAHAAEVVGLQLTPFDPSYKFDDAVLRSMNYENGRFEFGIGGESFRLGLQTPDAAIKGCANSAEGQHIHLIVNDAPYEARYESSFDYAIPDGEHYILAFLSRSYHESLKNTGAAIAVKAVVQNQSIVSSEPVTEPMLFYSRPKGLYEGADTRRVMLDYYLVNPDPGLSVVADINGEKITLDRWIPYYMDGLPAGENTITLTLVDGTGKPVPVDLNPVTGKFVLNPDPTAQ